MASPATMGARKSAQGEPARKPSLPPIPFTHAAHEHTEAISDNTSAILGANTQGFGPFDIPAYGFLRNVWLLVEATGGTDGTATAAADAPFNVLQNVSLEDVNGTAIFGPYNGDEIFAVNKYGGYQFFSDPEALPDYTGTACTFKFALRLPVEINPRTGLGCLANMNSSANYKLRYTINTLANVVTAIGTGVAPSVRVRAYLEAWSYSPETTRDGFPIQTVPPLLGTTQYWTKTTVVIAAGQNTIPLKRVGNQIRQFIGVFRLNSGVRDDTNYPDPLAFNWDARTVFTEAASYRRKLMGERYRYTRGTRDTGVFVYGYHHDGNGHPGGEDDGHLWLRTVQTSRLELVGSFGAAGTLTILTNDVAPVATAGRYVETSNTGGVPGEGAGASH
jgi:hypothetical protein